MSQTSTDEALALELHAALNTIIRRGALPRVLRRFNEVAGASFDRSTYWLAVRLAETGPIRLSQLADLEGTDLSTVSRQIHACEQVGMVTRRQDPSDARATLVCLTPHGQTMLQRMVSAQYTDILAAVAGWPEQDQQTFAHLLIRFASRFHDWVVSDGFGDQSSRPSSP